MKKRLLLFALAGMTASAGLDFDGGGDFRFREETWDKAPTRGGKVCPKEDFFRIRTRLWGQVKYGEDIRLYGRFTHEPRYYLAQHWKKGYTWPDEVLLDNLYLEWKEIGWDWLDMRVGRQDFYTPDGWVRVFGEGTPGDGSRTFYNDALAFTIHFDELNTWKLIGIYDSPTAGVSIGRPKGLPAEWDNERSLTNLELSTYDLVESGVFSWFTTKEITGMPIDIYSAWKNETDYRAKDFQTGAWVRRPGRNIFTQGLRVTPTFSRTLSAEGDIAGQVGQTHDGQLCAAWSAYGAVKYSPEVKFRPYIGPGLALYSGDENPREGTDTNWNSLWGRHTHFGELVGAYSYWNYYGLFTVCNTAYPHLLAGADFSKTHKIALHAGPLFALEDDTDYTGQLGDSLYRGVQSYIRYDFLLCKGLFGTRGDLKGMIWLELFQPGDYYGPADELAYFLRWQVSIDF